MSLLSVKDDGCRKEVGGGWSGNESDMSQNSLRCLAITGCHMLCNVRLI